MNVKHVLLVWVVILSSFQFWAQENWELKKDKNGIQIFTRPVSYSSFDEFKAITLLNTSLEQVLDELLSAPQYMKGAKPGISYSLGSLKPSEHLFYVRKNLPWPLKDRDIITLLTVEKISETKVKLRMESLPDGMPEKDQTIRIKHLMGHWLLEEKNGVTLVTQQLHVNPEGSLPTAITNSLLIKGPYKTFSNLQQLNESRQNETSK